jgi:hypothetical protein
MTANKPGIKSISSLDPTLSSAPRILLSSTWNNYLLGDQSYKAPTACFALVLPNSMDDLE